jgi:hypothetical protein
MFIRALENQLVGNENKIKEDTREKGGIIKSRNFQDLKKHFEDP